MQGIELNLLEAYGATFIVEKPLKKTTSGIIYKAEMYLEGEFFNAKIIKFWFGSGKLMAASTKEGHPCLLEVEDKIERWLTNVAKTNRVDYVKRFFMRLGCEIAIIAGYIGTGFTLYEFLKSFPNVTPNTILKGMAYLIAIVILKVVNLKVYSIKYEETKKGE